MKFELFLIDFISKIIKKFKIKRILYREIENFIMTEYMLLKKNKNN